MSGEEGGVETLRIYDEPGMVGSLALAALIDLLRPFAIQSQWRIAAVVDGDREYFEATGSAAEDLEALAQSGELVSIDALLKLAKKTRQVIWGHFDVGLDPTWLTLRAIDSTFVEVTTADRRVLGLLKSQFEDVRTYPAPWRSPWN